MKIHTTDGNLYHQKVGTCQEYAEELTQRRKDAKTQGLPWRLCAFALKMTARTAY
jgi:hypothetical protein